MRILFVLEYYYPHTGGVENFFQALTESLVEKGHEAIVLTTRLPGYQASEVINGVRVIRVKTPFNSRYFFSLAALGTAWRLAREADVVHTTTYTASFPAVFAAKLRRKPILITVHEIIGRMWRNLGMSWFSATLHYYLEQLVIRLPYDRIITDSVYGKNSLRLYGIDDRKLRTIYLFLETSVFDPSRYAQDRRRIRAWYGLERNHVVFAYGRPGITKGMEYLVRAFPRIKEHIGNAHLFLLLSRRPESGYRQITHLVRVLGIKDDMTIISDILREQVPAHLSIADTVVVPSLTEGFGFTTIESCLMGKPVVATNVGSIPEVVFGTYRLVEPRDPLAIAQAVVEVKDADPMNVPPKDFSVTRMTKEYLEEYSRLTS